MRKAINILSILLIALCLFAVAGFNIFQKDRPTTSESEKRELAAFPSFSWEALTDGSYFSGIEAFVSDTFLGRERLVDLSKRAELLYGNNGDRIIVIQNPENPDTDGPDIFIPEVTTPPVTEPPITEPPVTEPVITVVSVALDTDSIVMNVGEDKNVIVTLEIDTAAPEDLILTSALSNEGIVTIRAEEDNTFVIHAECAGDTVFTVSSPNGKSASCKITVLKSIDPGQTTEIGGGVFSDEPEFLTGSMFIYEKAVYSIPYLADGNARNFGKAMDYYASLFPNAKLSVLVAPLSSAMLADVPELQKKLTNQGSIIDTVFSYMSDNINKVAITDTLFSHRNEYLYFKSDHHWTALGAYYAYCEFAKSVGFEPTPLSSFEEILLNDSYQGSMYSYTKDERVKLIYDSVYAYIPTKAHTMTIYYANGGQRTYASSVATANRNYLAFIAGDNPYTVINVPDNPQDCNILVLKDSYGNALVPFLTEHYGNIIVIDPRYVTFNIYDLLADYPLRDILSVTNIYNPNVYSWTVNMLRIVGVSQ